MCTEQDIMGLKTCTEEIMGLKVFTEEIRVLKTCEDSRLGD